MAACCRHAQELTTACHALPAGRHTETSTRHRKLPSGSSLPRAFQSPAARALYRALDRCDAPASRGDEHGDHSLPLGDNPSSILELSLRLQKYFNISQNVDLSGIWSLLYSCCFVVSFFLITLAPGYLSHCLIINIFVPFIAYLISTVVLPAFSEFHYTSHL
jgi:hypothetical protein